MLSKELVATFFNLVRLGIGNDSVGYAGVVPDVDWNAIETLAAQHGLSAIIVDGVERLPEGQRPPKPVLLQWIGETLQSESVYAEQWRAACKMSRIFDAKGIRTYILKGFVVSECYPNPKHRVSVDLDCFLIETVQGSFPKVQHFDAWELGNQLMEQCGFDVDRSFYKNSTLYLPGLTVENHQYLTPFRGNKRLKELEKLLKTLILHDKGDGKFDGTWLYRPPVMVSALFLIEHAYSHFLHEGLTWRMVLDWILFSKKHERDISWTDLNAYIDDFGFRKFYDSFYRLGQYLMGEINDSCFTVQDKKMLADVWAPLDLHETDQGLKGKINLAGNTWRARWKYHDFSEISMIHALWIQVKGFLFIKHPKLD